MSRELEYNNRVCILAVNSSKWFLLRSIPSRKLKTPLGARLPGTLGGKRIVIKNVIYSLGGNLGLLGRFLNGYNFCMKTLDRLSLKDLLLKIL